MARALKMVIAFHKPFGVLSQFTPENAGDRTLAEFALPKGVYPLGRLDKDSEGLLLLTDQKGMNSRLLHPSAAHPREYWAQVERKPDQKALQKLRDGVQIKTGFTLPAQAELMPDPNLGERVPPIRKRKNIPTAWLRLVLTEGKNRQVRRMTAHVGFPTLRLYRARVGAFSLGALPPGQFFELDANQNAQIFEGSQ